MESRAEIHRSVRHRVRICVPITNPDDSILCFCLDDLAGPDDDFSNVPIEDDAFDELQAVVNKAMKLKTKKNIHSNEKVRNIAAQLIPFVSMAVTNCHSSFSVGFERIDRRTGQKIESGNQI